MRIEELCHCCSDLTEEAELGDLKEDSKLGNQWTVSLNCIVIKGTDECVLKG